jgi:hypothetical protein
MASETRTMVRRPPSTASRTVATVQRGAARSVYATSSPNKTTLPISRIFTDSPRLRARAQSSTETMSAPMSPAMGETRRISVKKTAKGERLSRMLTTSASGGW